MVQLDLFIFYTFSLAHFNSHSIQTITWKIGGGFCDLWDIPVKLVPAVKLPGAGTSENDLCMTMRKHPVAVSATGCLFLFHILYTLTDYIAHKKYIPGQSIPHGIHS